ncbi:hypothetical protein ABTP03_19745, partial [Acinetobacter baumannii]
ASFFSTPLLVFFAWQASWNSAGGIAMAIARKCRNAALPHTEEAAQRLVRDARLRASHHEGSERDEFEGFALAPDVAAIEMTA